LQLAGGQNFKVYITPRVEVCSGNYLKALWGVREMPSLFLVNSQIW